MAFQETGGYKNPKMPNPRDVESGPSVGTAAPVAPARGGGLMQRAAAARLRQTKVGQPPIPSPPVTQQPPERAKLAPMTDPGQRRDDLERERLRLQQEEQRRRRAEAQTKKAELLQMQKSPEKPDDLLQAKTDSDYRRQAIQEMAAKGIGEEDEYPTIQKAEKQTQSFAMKQAGGGAYDDESGAQAGGPQAYDESVDPSSDPAAGTDEALKVQADIEEQKKQDALKAAQDAKDAEEAAALEGEEGEDTSFYNENGEKIGYKGADGNFYDVNGNQIDPISLKGKGPYYTEKEYQTKFPAKHAYNQTLSQLSDWLTQKTGIPEEELQGQIAQVHMQSADQIAKFANLMAARGVGAGGLMGAGMGQIASQAVAAIANIKFENEKLKIEEKLNKMKTAAALAGQYMSEENRMKLFDEMSKLDQDKFNWQKEQDENANFWADLNDTAALLQAKNGWDEGALAKAQAARDAGWTAAEVQQYLTVSDEGKIEWKGDDPPGYQYKGGGGGYNPGYGPGSEPYTEAESWAEEQYSNTPLEDPNNPGSMPSKDYYAQSFGYPTWAAYIQALSNTWED